MTAPSAAILTAYQAALAAELRALYGYDVVGPRVAAADVDLVRSSTAAHTTLRDAAITALTRLGATPVGPRADYPDLYPVGTGASAARTAAGLEDACTAAWRYLYDRAAEPRETGTTAIRTTAQGALSAGAVRATRWRLRAGIVPATVPFPGITDG